jgi:hypothetical protein
MGGSQWSGRLIPFRSLEPQETGHDGAHLKAVAVVLQGGLLRQTVGDFGEAWVEAVCIAAGFVPNRLSRDRRGVDIMVEDPSGDIVRIQVKATERPNIIDQSLRFDLPVATYDMLRRGTTYGHLVVVVFDRPYPNWIHQGTRRALVRAEGFWQRLSGMPPVSNHSDVRIGVPLVNRFRPESLWQLFAE